MSSKQKVEVALALTQRQLFRKFMAILLLALLVIEAVVGGIFFYDLYRVETKIMTSLSVEYQRILKFESDDKLDHVIRANPQRLVDNHIAAFVVPNPAAGATPGERAQVRFLAGERQIPADLDFSAYQVGDHSWISAFLANPYMTLKMQGKDHAFWLVLDNQARYPVAMKQWLMTFLALVLLACFTSVFIWRLIHNTLQPLVVLGHHLDDLSRGTLDAFSRHAGEAEVPQGLAAINHSVRDAVSRLHGVVTTMDRTLDAIAHDIRTPLSRIQLSTENALLSALQGEEKSALQANALADCSEYAAQASNLLTALMKLNDEQTGKRTVQRTPVNVNDILRRVSSWYEDIAELKGIELQCDPAPSLMMDSDADKLTQILVNLVDNALKFTEADGRVTLTSATLAQGGVALQVADTGIGIAPEHQALVFKRLYRVDESRSNTEGYGLGLSLAAAMVRNLGGTMTLTSEPGQGSTFTVMFPNAVE
ncbi:HAMP domain-containing sensor histidine kinase [Photobacterium sp. MCCC 1A19761]|uniref:sensor histidine kinase n=1 Tax=Photobacterium sp. MCCC 1A19761 TaxID=3115000 RepID=UPI00307D88D8